MRFLHTKETLLLTLLQAIAENRKFSVTAFTTPHVQWAIETGVGPFLFYFLKSQPDEAIAASLRSLLQSADLTAQVLTGELLAAVEDILDCCAASVGEGNITLLKGVSVGQQCYPKPHLRTMRDIDILVDDALLPKVETLLRGLGYRQTSKNPPAYYFAHHHSMPFVHPATGIWVEVHRGLMPPQSLIGQEKIFSLDNIKAELRSAEFHGKKVSRLSNELQVVYIAAHWSYSLTVVGGIISLCDMVLLLKQTQPSLQWGRILGWLERSVATSYLYLMLTYLRRYELIEIPTGVFQELRRRQPSFNMNTLRILHLLIDRYIVAGQPCGVVLSPARLSILWDTLLTPGSPSGNLLNVPRNFLTQHLP